MDVLVSMLFTSAVDGGCTVSMLSTNAVDGGCTGLYAIHECSRSWMYWLVCYPRVR